jgi:hypothetical protein
MLFVAVLTFCQLLAYGARLRVSAQVSAEDVSSSGIVVKGKIIMPCKWDLLGLVTAMNQYSDMIQDFRNASSRNPAKLPWSWTEGDGSNAREYQYPPESHGDIIRFFKTVRQRRWGDWYQNRSGEQGMSFTNPKGAEVFMKKMFEYTISPGYKFKADKLLNNILDRAKREGQEGRRRRFFGKSKKKEGCSICKVKYVGGHRDGGTYSVKPEGWVQARCVNYGNEDEDEQMYDEDDRRNEDEEPDLTDEGRIKSVEFERYSA